MFGGDIVYVNVTNALLYGTIHVLNSPDNTLSKTAFCNNLCVRNVCTNSY